MTTRIVPSCVLLAFVWCAPLWAANGDITELADHCNTSGARAIDLCVDSTDEAIYVVDQLSSDICRYDMDGTANGAITHPFGVASFPTFTPVISGIAYNVANDTLVVLNRTEQTLRELNKMTGVGIGPVSLIMPPDPTRNPMGLTYDEIGGTLWFRDVNNNTVVECATNGFVLRTIELPHAEERIYGEGVTFTEEDGERFLEIAFGTVLDCKATEVYRIDLSGDLTGHHVSLDQVPGMLHGIARGLDGATLYACTNTQLLALDWPQTETLPPTMVTSRSDDEGSVILNWNNHGTGVDGAYSDIDILRSTNNGLSYAVIETLPGNQTTYMDTEPSTEEGLLGRQLIYRVRTGTSALDVSSECVMHTGPGALISYQQFDGDGVYDLAFNDAAGELYVTSNDASGRIYVYDRDMNLDRTINTGLSFLRGIAYNSMLDVLVVSSGSTTLLNRFDTLGFQLGAFTTPVSGITIGSLTYDPFEDDYLYLNLTDKGVVRIDASDSSPGVLIEECSPPSVSGLNLARGITYLEGESFLSTVAPGAFFQFDSSSCFPLSGQSIALDGLGSCANDPDAVNGIVNVVNVAYVAVGSTNTIAKLLVVPAGSGFVRGDSNDDHEIDITDVVSVANYVFASGVRPACLDAADANDDGRISVSDPLYLIMYLFLNGPMPPAPFQGDDGALEPGLDPTFLDGLGC